MLSPLQILLKTEIVKGFVFEVNHSGTMPISGGYRAERLFARITRDAGLLGTPLPLTGYGQ